MSLRKHSSNNTNFVGATLVLACRDVEKGINAKKDILQKLSNKNVKIFIKHLDLASITSILKFSESLKSEFNEIYALVNNAGIFYYPHTVTEDGFEITFQANYLGMTELVAQVI
jgi:retinol dehydrogenase-12